MVARRAVVRWALRLFRREWRQQVLVTTLLTVAVGAAVFAASAAYNVAPSRDAEFGSADQRFLLSVSNPEALGPYLSAAEEWFGAVDVIGHRSVQVPGSIDGVEIRSQDPDGAYGSPMLALRDGRFPTGDPEVALTDRVAVIFDAGVGDAVVLDGTERIVVGLVENPGALDDEFALVTPTPSETPDAVTILVRATDDRVDSFTFAEDPGTGFIESRGQTEKANAAVVVLVVATVAMLLVSLVAAAGFVAVAQRRLRQLGMLAAVGATERHLRLVMVANGVTVGAIAAAVGTAVALAGWVAFAPTFEGAAGHRIDRFDVPWWLIAAGVVIAVGTATAAAWWPARSVARVPIVRALSARPPRPAAAHRSALVAALLLVVGVVCLAAGVDPARDYGNPLLLIPGAVATVTAVLFMAPPAIRVLASLAGRLPLASRLAVRDLARYQARSGAALGAISLGLGIAVSVVVIAAAAEYGAAEGNLSDRQLVVWTGSIDLGDLRLPERTPDELRSFEPVVERIARMVDERVVVPLDVAIDPAVEEGRSGQILRTPALLGRRVGENTLRDSGRVFVATPELLTYLGVDLAAVDPATVLLTTQPGDVYLTGDITNTRFRTDPVPDGAVQRIDVPDYGSAPRSFLTEPGLQAATLAPMRAGWLIEARAPFTDSQLADARAMAADAGLTIESRDQQDGLVTLRTSASVAGVLLALGILAMTVGLIRGESARDLRTLTATGATSRTRRALTAGTAGALAVLAVILGMLTAYIALLAGYWPDTGRLSNVPIVHLVGIAVGLPLVATVASWVLGGREPAELARQAID
jgi:putative ABC transport system permease protein